MKKSGWILLLLMVLSGCFEQTQDDVFEVAKDIKKDDIDTTGDTVSTYSGTFHLEAFLQKDASNCDLEEEEDQEKLFEEIEVIKDSYNCTQSNKAYKCQSVQHAELLFEGEITEKSFKLNLADTVLPYAEDVNYGSKAKTTTNLIGSFYSKDLANNATMTYAHQVTAKALREGKTCKLVWKTRLFRDENDQSSEKSPVISNLTVGSEDELDVILSFEADDPDTDDAQLTIHQIYFEKETAPEQKEIDWKKATKLEYDGQHILEGLEPGKTYIIYLKVEDEGGNIAIESHEFTTDPLIEISDLIDDDEIETSTQTISKETAIMTLVIIEDPTKMKLGKWTPSLKVSKNMPFWINTGVVHKDKKLVGAFTGELIDPATPLTDAYTQASKDSPASIPSIDPAPAGGNFNDENGVLGLTEDGKLTIHLYTDNDHKSAKYIWALQNGPVLLLDGVNLHDKDNKKHLYMRTGLGILPDGKLLYVKSEEEMNLHDFAQIFDSQNVDDAIFLDGNAEKDNGFEVLDIEEDKVWKDEGVEEGRPIFQFFDTDVKVDVIFKKSTAGTSDASDDDSA